MWFDLHNLRHDGRRTVATRPERRKEFFCGPPRARHDLGMMRARDPFLALALVFGLACTGSGSKQESAPKPAPAAPAPPPAAAKPPAEPPAPAAPEPSPITAATLPPKQVVSGDDVTITQLVDGSVNLKTTTLWNEAIDTTYQSCDYYRDAIPVLKRQLTKERGKLLDKVCLKTTAKKAK